MINQIPLETVFMSNSSNSHRDPIHKNRIHFTFPDSWTNLNSKEAIVGIRDIYICKTYRHPEIELKYTLKFMSMQDSPQVITNVKSGQVRYDKFFDDQTLLKDFISGFRSVMKSQIKFDDVFTLSNDFIEEQITEINKVDFLTIYFEFVKDPNTNEHYSRLVINSPFNNLPVTYRTRIITESASSYRYFIEFEISSINDDAKILFNYDPSIHKSSNTNIFMNNIWDRNSCILYSNLSYMSDGSFLGHTRKLNLPKLKYYVLNSSNRSFWVDLYSTCDHKSPVYLPDDNKEELFIEAQLLTNATSVL